MTKTLKNPLVVLAGAVAAIVIGLILLAPSDAGAADRYQSMTELQQQTQEGVDWQIDTKQGTNDTVIVAPHGGGIEPGTSQIAEEVANRNNASYYSFQGIRPTNNKELHVTSIHYDEPKAQEMVNQSQRTVTIHKTARSGNDIYVGGRDAQLRNNISQSLTQRGFDVAPATGNIAGQSLNNITNQNQQQAGVQIELNNQFANQFFKNGNVFRPERENPENYTQQMHSFADGVNEGLNQSQQ
ncbi:poly-gamma-glutamate hydrolase family protein [Staphylococcus simulans]|uniref:poly-gamma-glutamate hydrolase family protein n=1 Tax=Staphylococcus simulans TaxID=1286 RepID=UPI001E5D4866|nr:poly-gamma-glutamate hydrolase family protein [Staphylococcus simulans]MCD8915521.1 poly-gamma-glutamate hydrolase family protein [Staphylococcus simulans]